MRSRRIQVLFRLDEQEHSHLKKQVQLSGLSTEAFLRRLIMGVELHPRPPDEYAALLRELSAIGNNLNQLARVANATGSISAKTVEAMLEHHSEIWRKVKSL